MGGRHVRAEESEFSRAAGHVERPTVWDVEVVLFPEVGGTVKSFSGHRSFGVVSWH